MMLNLTDPRYQYGSYTRGDCKPDILFSMISFGGIEALITPSFAMARDRWEERHRASLDPERSRAYRAALQKLLLDVGKEDVFHEKVLEAVLSFRNRFFREELDRLFLRDAEEPDIDLDKRDIDQSDRMEGLAAKGGSVLFLLQDARYTGLMRRDLRELGRKGLRLYAAVSETERGLFPSERQIRAVFPDDTLRLLPCEGPLSGLDGERELKEDTDRGCVFILYYGERGLTDCRNLAVPSMVRCVPESMTGKTVTGQFLRKGRCDLWIPPHFDIVKTVPLGRRTLASFRQFDVLSRRYGDGVYAMTCDALYRKWPEVFFSVYDEDQEGLPEGTSWPEAPMAADWYADFCNRRDAVLGGMIEKVPGVQRLGGWFTLDTMEQKPVPWAARGEAEGILVHGILLEKAADAEVIVSEGKAVSPRRMAADSKSEGPGLVLNYLFFLTPRLGELYNRLREDRPREQALLQGGHLDYMLRKQDGKRTETFPLFRKACMAMKDDGTFTFFHFRLGGGACIVNGQEIRWSPEDVDPSLPGAVAVYTPYLSCPDAGADRFTYTKEIGADRVNLVMIQDRLACVRAGSVILPGIGAVLSLEKKAGLHFLQTCGFIPTEDDYYSWNGAPDIRLELNPPEGFSAEEWRQVRWAYGGGLTLIHDGESCFADEDIAARHLAREGWMSPLSAQTQESDIAAMVRHPRTAIGITARRRLFALVFSGRSAVSAGADYREMCRIAKILVPDVKELMNVDGGGSSVLAVTEGGRFFEFSQPSASPDTPPGMVRPINTLFRIQLL